MSLSGGDIEETQSGHVTEAFSEQHVNEGPGQEVGNSARDRELENLLVLSSSLQHVETSGNGVSVVGFGDLSESAFPTRVVSPITAPGTLGIDLQNTSLASEETPRRVLLPRSAASPVPGDLLGKAEAEKFTFSDFSGEPDSNRGTDSTFYSEDCTGYGFLGSDKQTGICPSLQQQQRKPEKLMALSSSPSSQQMLLQWEAVVAQQRDDEEQVRRWQALQQNLQQQSDWKSQERVHLLSSPSEESVAQQGSLGTRGLDAQGGLLPGPREQDSHGEQRRVQEETGQWERGMLQDSSADLRRQQQSGDSQCGGAEARQRGGAYSQASVQQEPQEEGGHGHQSLGDFGHQLQSVEQRAGDRQSASAGDHQEEQPPSAASPPSSAGENQQGPRQALHQEASGGDKQSQEDLEKKRGEEGPMSLQRQHSGEVAGGGGGGGQLSYAEGVHSGLDRGARESHQGCPDRQQLLIQQRQLPTVKPEELQHMQHQGERDVEMKGGSHEHIPRGDRLLGEQAQQQQQQIGQVPVSGGVLHMVNQPQGGGNDQRVVQHKQQQQQHVFFPGGGSGSKDSHMQFFRHDYQAHQQVVKPEQGASIEHVPVPYHHQMMEHNPVRQCSPSQAASHSPLQAHPPTHLSRGQFFAHSEGHLTASQASRGESPAQHHTGPAPVPERQQEIVGSAHRRAEGGGMRTRAVTHQEEEQRRRLEHEERVHQQHQQQQQQQQQQAALEELHRQELQALHFFQASGQMGDFLVHQQRLMQHQQQAQQIHMHLQQQMHQHHQHQAQGAFLHPHHHHFAAQAGGAAGRGCAMPQNTSPQNVIGFSQAAHAPHGVTAVGDHPQVVQGYIAARHAGVGAESNGGSTELDRSSSGGGGSGKTRPQQPHAGGCFAGGTDEADQVNRNVQQHQHHTQFEVGSTEGGGPGGTHLHHCGDDPSSGTEVYGGTPVRPGRGGGAAGGTESVSASTVWSMTPPSGVSPRAGGAGPSGSGGDASAMIVRESGKGQSNAPGEGLGDGSSSVASTAAVSSSPSTPGAVSLSSSFSAFSPYVAGHPTHTPPSATHAAAAAAYFQHNPPPQHPGSPYHHQAGPDGHFLAIQQQAPPKTGFPPCHQFHPYVHPSLQHHPALQHQQQQHQGGGWGAGTHHQFDKIFGTYSSGSSPSLLQQTSDGGVGGTPAGMSGHTQHPHSTVIVHTPQHHHLQHPPHHPQHVFAAAAVTPVKTSPPRPGSGAAGGGFATSASSGSRRSSANSAHKQHLSGTPTGSPSFSVDPLLLSASTGLPSETSSLHSGSRRSSLHGLAEERGSSRRSSAHSCSSVSTPNKERAAVGLGSSRRRSGGTAHQPGIKSDELFANASSSQALPAHSSAGGEPPGAEAPASSTGGVGGGKGDRGGTKDANGNLRGPYAVFTTPLTVPPPPELEAACVRLAELKAQPLIQQWLDSRDVSWSFAFALVFNARLAAGSVNVNVRWAREPTVVGGAFLVGKGKTYSWRRAPQEASPHIILQCFEAACKERQKTFGRSQHVDDYLLVIKNNVANAWRLDAEGLQQAADSLITLHGLDIFCGFPVVAKQVKDLLRFDPHGNWFSLTAQSPPLPPSHFFFPSRNSHNPASASAVTGDDGITPESERLATPDRVLTSDGAGEASSLSGGTGGGFSSSAPTYVFQCAEPDCLALLYTLNRVRHFCMNAKLRVAAATKASQEGLLMETGEGGDTEGPTEQEDDGKERDDDTSQVGGYAAYVSSPSCQIPGARTLIHPQHHQQQHPAALQPSPIDGAGGLALHHHHRTQFPLYNTAGMTGFPPPASYPPLSQTGLVHPLHPPPAHGAHHHILSAPPPSIMTGRGAGGGSDETSMNPSTLQSTAFPSPSLVEKKFCFGGNGGKDGGGLTQQVGTTGCLPPTHVKEENEDEKARSIPPGTLPSTASSRVEGSDSAFQEGISTCHSAAFAEEKEKPGMGEEPGVEMSREGSVFSSDQPPRADDSSPVDSQASPSSATSGKEGGRKDEDTGGVYRSTRRSRKAQQLSAGQQAFPHESQFSPRGSWAEQSLSKATEGNGDESRQTEQGDRGDPLVPSSYTHECKKTEEGREGEAATEEPASHATPEGENASGVQGEEFLRPGAHAPEQGPDEAGAHVSGEPKEGVVRGYTQGEEKAGEYRGGERFIEGQTVTTAAAEMTGGEDGPLSPHCMDENGSRDYSEQGADGRMLQTEENPTGEVSSDDNGKEGAETPTRGTVGGNETTSFASAPLVESNDEKSSPRRRSSRRRSRRSSIWTPASSTRSAKRRKTQGAKAEDSDAVKGRSAGGAMDGDETGERHTEESFFSDINGVTPDQTGGEHGDQAGNLEGQGTANEHTKSGEGDLTSTRDEGECLSSQEIMHVDGEKESEYLSAKDSPSPSSREALSPMNRPAVRPPQQDLPDCFHDASNEELLQGNGLHHVNCEAAWMEEARADSHVRAFFVDCCADGDEKGLESGGEADTTRARTNSSRRAGGGKRKTGGDGGRRRKKAAEARRGTDSPVSAIDEKETGEASSKDGDEGEVEEGQDRQHGDGSSDDKSSGGGEEEHHQGDENESREGVPLKPESGGLSEVCNDGGSGSYEGEREKRRARGRSTGQRKGHVDHEGINGGMGDNSCDLHFLDDDDAYTPASGASTQVDRCGPRGSAGEADTGREVNNTKGGKRTRGSMRS